MLRKRNKGVRDERMAGRRRSSDEVFRVGRTIAGDAQKIREEKIARATDLRRRKTKNIIIVATIVVVLLIISILLICYIIGIVHEQNELMRPVETPEPIVEILDENIGKNISSRTKEFVTRLENDVSEYGLKVDRVVLPFQKARELDVYLKDRSEDYKLSLDRGSAVQAEDMSRMSLYLDKKEIKPEYVDLRVEGRAYYK